MAFTANTHSLFSHLSFGGIVLLTHSSGFVFSFYAFVLFSNQLSRHRRDDLWLPQPDTALELVSHEKNLAPPQGYTQFSRTSLIGLTWVTSYFCASHWVREIGCSKVRLVICSVPGHGTSALAPLYVHAQDGTGSAPIWCLFHYRVH